MFQFRKGSRLDSELTQQTHPGLENPLKLLCQLLDLQHRPSSSSAAVEASFPGITKAIWVSRKVQNKCNDLSIQVKTQYRPTAHLWWWWPWRRRWLHWASSSCWRSCFPWWWHPVLQPLTPPGENKIDRETSGRFTWQMVKLTAFGSTWPNYYNIMTKQPQWTKMGTRPGLGGVVARLTQDLQLGPTP